jgi:periplasmic protein TonB
MAFRIRSRSLKAAIAVSLWALVAWAQEATKKVSNSEASSAAVTKVAPEYPAMAKQLKIQGAVELEAVVTEAGAVEKVSIVSGNPVLTKSAVEALKKWKFTPFQQDGKVVKAVAQITMNFKL